MTVDNFQSTYRTSEPPRTEVNSSRGITVVEFGAPWCPICQAAQPNIEAAIRERPDIEHLKIEDGSGQPLGRSFRIKLWPTLIVMKDGIEVARTIRPANTETIREAISKAA